MTQPSEAVGGEPNAPEPTLDDRLNAAFGDEPEATDEDDEDEEDAPEGDEPEAADAEDNDEAADEAGDESPEPIAPPVSWDAEAKERFAKLPREDQEYLAKREGERERFVQTKAQEAKQARTAAEREALIVIENVQREAAQRLDYMAAQLAVPEPDPNLIVEDPEAYAQQLRAHRHYAAQSYQAQQQAAQARAMADQAHNEARQAAQQQTLAILQEQFPEYLSDEHGPKLRQELGAVAIELGFTQEELAEPDARDILAMKAVATYKSKADKYDALMAKKMEGVRAAKSLPKVSRPGAAAGKGQVRSERYAADRQAMRAGDKQAEARVLDAFFNSK